MSRIKLMPETLASQVAAGEVVERPAAVVKELVENSIDAGARNIEVLVQRGGISLVRVIDDGCGMDRDDALLSLERHATSKISSVDDLNAIGTLGFRGEALPSIASVSRFRLTTRERNAIAGTEIIAHGGRIDAVRDSGTAPGTQVEVRSLFFNVPARRKFLRSQASETRAIEHQFFLQAVAHPAIGFVFVRDENSALQLPATSSLRERIRDLYGPELLTDLLEIVPAKTSSTPVREPVVTGWIGRAGISRQTRSQQFTFVNGRAIESPILTSALREGYHTALMRGQFPITFLFIDLDRREVDVNVHPAKREVRFRDPTKIREAVVRAIQGALSAARDQWQQKFHPPSGSGPASAAAVFGNSCPQSPTELPHLEREFAMRGEKAVELRPSSAATVSTEQQLEEPEQRPAPPERGSNRAAPAQHFQIIGVLNKLYVLMENADGLVLVDQHAAHERILFEELRRRMEEQGVPAQRMLLSQVFSLPPRDAEWVECNVETLQRMGIGLENFGGNTFRVDSLPPFLEVANPAEFLRKVIDELRTTTRSSSPLRLGEDLIAKSVCRHAIKANDLLHFPEIEKLIRDLLACELPYCCPHGRPTMIQISLAELDKKFGRKV